MQRVTKQAETRDLVLDLIEQLSVGQAIPSERQLSSDFGVSRLTVRAALDDLVRVREHVDEYEREDADGEHRQGDAHPRGELLKSPDRQPEVDREAG